jgi:hypothetical protein
MSWLDIPEPAPVAQHSPAFQTIQTLSQSKEEALKLLKEIDQKRAKLREELVKLDVMAKMIQVTRPDVCYGDDPNGK